ncbi:hypothetical protein GC102_26635 [Paenibacillus sp. LMG 31460]|uniref:Uncharacterized protein n=1 Tax=Paenibacillus germinis TaxID=2654979 RepID=A0ABX1Z7P2_9BACL|nr:hypothetical protein [Paenibacillus germinis]NOU89302.1 hypothetical protein [Paenibacillus germinis]
MIDSHIKTPLMYNLFFLDYEISITPYKTNFKYRFMIFVIRVEMIPISIIADKVVLKADEGGVWGNPFESLTIDRGSVVVSDYGGSKRGRKELVRINFNLNDM